MKNPSDTENILLLNQLPFNSQCFYASTHGNETTAYNCLVLKAADITPPQSLELMAQLVGLDKFEAHLKRLHRAHHVGLFRQAVTTTLGRRTETTLARLNMIIQGPSGTGKTTAAKIAGTYFVANKFVSGNRVIVVNGIDLCGRHVGETKTVVNKLMDYCKTHVLIVDSAGSLCNKEGRGAYADEARTQLNDTMEEFNKSGGIVIFIDYPDRIRQLLRDEPGYNGRFPTDNRIDLGAHDDAQTLKVLKIKVEMEGLSLTAEAEALASAALHNTKMGLGEKFNNGRTTEEYVREMINLHSNQFDEALLKSVINGTVTPPENFLNNRSTFRSRI